MIRRLLRCLAVGLALLLALSFIGCSGGGSTAKEETPAPAQVDAVTVSDNGTTATMTVHFNLSINPPVTDMDPANVRFTVAKLIPASGGNSSYWQSYINRGTTAVVQATYERANTTGGAFTNNGDGTYSYKFSFNFRKVTSPVAVTYEPNRTHRVAMQVADNVTNSVFDFVPSNPNATPASREIVTEKNCSNCHEKFAFHGGDRVSVKYCVTCHNPGSTDAESGNTVDFKVMIHKIHYGENLPSVEAGVHYVIANSDYSEVVFPRGARFPGLPDDTCTSCHRPGDAANSGSYLTVPTMEACGACHDRTSFSDPAPSGYTLHSGGVQATNSGCASCHPASSGGAVSAKFPGGANVTAVHQLPASIEAQKFQYHIISVTDPAGGPVDPGDQVKVVFSVNNPTDPSYDANNPLTATYNILADPPYFPVTSAKALTLLIGWDTRDYTNTGSGSAPTATTGTPAQPYSINALTAGVAKNNGDGSFTVTSAAIPLTATGTGVVAIQGHPGVDVNGDGTLDQIAVTNVVKYFPITGATAVPRRSVVDIEKCKNCHGVLSLHGNNRTDNIGVCVICHNPNATDINRRPGVVPPPPINNTNDHKREETIDFKYMIHAIHAGDKTRGIKTPTDLGFRESGTGIVVYGFNSSVNYFGDTRLPSGFESLKNCGRCHITTGSTGTYQLPLNTNVLPTTFWTETAILTDRGTGADRSVPTDNTFVTPTASVCSSCHNSTTVISHMQQNGGVFNLIYGASITETCALCHGPGKEADVAVKHQAAVGTIIGVIAPPPSGGGGGTGGQSQADLCGPGPISAQPPGHPNRTDCCSCHGFK